MKKCLFLNIIIYIYLDIYKKLFSSKLYITKIAIDYFLHFLPLIIMIVPFFIYTINILRFKLAFQLLFQLIFSSIKYNLF